MAHLLTYLVARENAREMDLQGFRPGGALKALVLVPAYLLIAFVVGAVLYVAVTMALGI